MSQFNSHDGFRELDAPSPNTMETGAVDRLHWGDLSTSPNPAPDPFMDWRVGHNTDQTYQASHVDNAEQDFSSDLSLLNQGPPLDPEYSSDSLQKSSMQNIFSTNDQEEVERTNEQEDEGSTIFPRPPKSDRRGSHWKKKAQQGACPQPWQGNKDWAGKVVEMEMAYKAHPDSGPLPWEIMVPVYPKVGNMLKALYLTLLRLERDRVVRLTRAAGSAPESFFGIALVEVLPDKRAAFDAGPFPSVIGLKLAGRTAGDAGVKWAKKAWETAGFEEAPPYPGRPALTFHFDVRLRDKQRRQQPSQAQRAARRRPDAE